MLRIGVDLGGSKIELIALDERGGELLRRRVATPAGDYRATLAAIAGLVDWAEGRLSARAEVGIGTPGTISPDSGLMKNCNSVCLNGQPLQDDLQALLGRPVRLANDANCFSLSEASDGAAAGADVVFGVILGTGCGAGVVVHGRVLTGPNGVAGEWGHNPLPWPQPDELPGPPCYCGKRGCVETWLSGPGLAAAYRAAAGREAAPADIAARAAAGEPLCERVMADYEDRLARGLAHVVNILDPDVIVLGGGLSNLARLYENVPVRWRRYVFSDHVRTRLVPPRHGDSSGVRGAAWLAGS